MKIVECVPNFSEGRDRKKIDAIADVIKSVPDVKLLDVDPGADTNRTVVTFVGTPEAAKEAAFRAIKKAAELIDMSKHKGAHARMGATDVCPFIPVSGVTMDDCVQLARELGERVGRELEIPVYLYEHAASKPERRNLAEVRAGEYEGLSEKLAKPEWAPDYGPAKFNHKSGTTIIGARDFLIAYNVNLNTKDKKLAHEIALDIREGGRPAKGPDGKALKDANGNTVKTPGKLKCVKAVGWYIEQYGQAQISINLTNWKVTPPHAAFEAAREGAQKLGLRVTGSELVGLIPLEPLLEAGRFYLAKQGKSTGVPDSELIASAVLSLGLDQLSEFDPQRKVIEYQFAPNAPLMSMTAKRFVDEVSSDSPAPGGGSVAALSGALGAALASMVANLTVGKKGYEATFARMDALAREGQSVKDALCKAVDDDTSAFNSLMEAMRLPKKTPEQIAARDAAMQDGYKKAIEVPLHTAKLCLKALELAKEVAEKGNKNSASDAGVAALEAWTGVEGALMNVLINLKEVKDHQYKSKMVETVQKMKKEAAVLRDAVMATMDAALSG
jgi:glutamate formiminotransferase/formiminotetrahydrofolate cyclodeaminase